MESIRERRREEKKREGPPVNRKEGVERERKEGEKEEKL